MEKKKKACEFKILFILIFHFIKGAKNQVVHCVACSLCGFPHSMVLRLHSVGGASVAACNTDIYSHPRGLVSGRLGTRNSQGIPAGPDVQLGDQNPWPSSRIGPFLVLQ